MLEAALPEYVAAKPPHELLEPSRGYLDCEFFAFASKNISRDIFLSFHFRLGLFQYGDVQRGHFTGAFVRGIHACLHRWHLYF